MNLDQIKFDPDTKAAIRAIGKRRLQDLFKQIKQTELERIEHVEEQALTGVKARVKLITELENLFLQVLEPASRKPNQPAIEDE